jgi:hydroxybutyrate-dimer hydrolase
MPLKKDHNFERIAGVAVFRLSREASPDQIRRLTISAIKAARQQELDQLLVVIPPRTPQRHYSIPFRHSVMREWAEAAAGMMRVAIVIRPESIDPQRFGIVVAKNFGTDMNVFTAEADALAWLDDNPGRASTDAVASAIRETVHRDADDLLSAGLGLEGLRAALQPFANAEAPTPAELRRRAIHASWQGIADLGPLGGYGELYGGVARVPGREYQVFARIRGAQSPHRILVQIPDAFDANARCLVVTAASGSRGIYGAIALAGAWGLPRGCAVAYTDKGAGTGYFDCATATGCALDGTRAYADDAELEFVPPMWQSGSGIAVKHAHSGENPEANWGACVLQAARFGLEMLDRAFPQLAPFTPDNTRIIAVGLSNAGGAVLQAAGIDDEAMLSGVVAVAPNIHVARRSSRPLYNYATEAALLMPAALTDARFDAIPFARVEGQPPAAWKARGTTLREAGMLDTQSTAAEALERLHAAGWTDAALATAASTTAFDMWRALAATYASAYARTRVGKMPGGFRFAAHDEAGKLRAPTLSESAAWWSDAAGIPPGAGVFLDETALPDAADPAFTGLRHLRGLWTGKNALAMTVRVSIAATAARLPRSDLPIWIIHGADDGLLPVTFSAKPYMTWLRNNGRTPVYWPIRHVQHFDAWLALPGFGDRYVPLLPYAYFALDRMWSHLVEGAALPSLPPPAASPRGAGKLDASHLALPAR